jgi:hypothetical protein
VREPRPVKVGIVFRPTENTKNEISVIMPDKNKLFFENESLSFTPETPAKRISLKNGVDLNCFYVMETVLASKPASENENISTFYKTNKMIAKNLTLNDS